eukprot:TRINITY_DN9488_c0_g1_i1.p1 TRINITY_DN9488_c0_g1~~TRINITY_DN9488_c0_g1_i1.p1  ORF type:complete len:406 (+),score=51.27 TRINITY_DN9488_c0_g1_i1:29-1246(+)
MCIRDRVSTQSTGFCGEGMADQPDFIAPVVRSNNDNSEPPTFLGTNFNSPQLGFNYTNSTRQVYNDMVPNTGNTPNFSFPNVPQSYNQYPQSYNPVQNESLNNNSGSILEICPIVVATHTPKTTEWLNNNHGGQATDWETVIKTFIKFHFTETKRLCTNTNVLIDARPFFSVIVDTPKQQLPNVWMIGASTKITSFKFISHDINRNETSTSLNDFGNLYTKLRHLTTYSTTKLPYLNEALLYNCFDKENTALGAMNLQIFYAFLNEYCTSDKSHGILIHHNENQRGMVIDFVKRITSNLNIHLKYLPLNLQHVGDYTQDPFADDKKTLATIEKYVKDHDDLVCVLMEGNLLQDKDVENQPFVKSVLEKLMSINKVLFVACVSGGAKECVTQMCGRRIDFSTVNFQ